MPAPSEEGFRAVSSDTSCRFASSGRRSGRLYFIVPKKDGGLRPILDIRVLNNSVMQLKFKMLTLKQIVTRTVIRGLVCHDRLQGRIIPHIHLSVSQEVPEVRFRGPSLPILGSSARPSIITPHFYEMHRCISGASASSGYSHIELVDSSSVESVGSLAS